MLAHFRYIIISVYVAYKKYYWLIYHQIVLKGYLLQKIHHHLGYIFKGTVK